MQTSMQISVQVQADVKAEESCTVRVDNGDDCVSIVPTGEWIDGGDFCYRDPANRLCSGGHAVVRKEGHPVRPLLARRGARRVPITVSATVKAAQTVWPPPFHSKGSVHHFDMSELKACAP